MSGCEPATDKPVLHESLPSIIWCNLMISISEVNGSGPSGKFWSISVFITTTTLTLQFTWAHIASTILIKMLKAASAPFGVLKMKRSFWLAYWNERLMLEISRILRQRYGKKLLLQWESLKRVLQRQWIVVNPSGDAYVTLFSHLQPLLKKAQFPDQRDLQYRQHTCKSIRHFVDTWSWAWKYKGLSCPKWCMERLRGSKLCHFI